MSERTEHTGGAEHQERLEGSGGTGTLLDFPGAAELIAAGDVAGPAADVVAAAQAAVAAAAQDEARLGTGSGITAPTATGTGPRAGTFPRRRRVLVAAAAVAAIAAGAVAYPVLDLGGEATATASAGEFLDEMARVAADGPVSRAPYWKVRVATENQDDGKRTDTRWFDRKGRVWSLAPDGTVEAPPARGTGKVKRWPVGDGWLTWPQIGKLPTEQKALEARFPRNARARLDQVTLMLEDSPAGPQLRATLFRILADIPGIKLLGETKDSRGRSGVAVEATRKITGYATDTEKPVQQLTSDLYIVDPRTGLLLETVHRVRGQKLPADRWTWLEVGPAWHIKKEPSA